MIQVPCIGPSPSAQLESRPPDGSGMGWWWWGVLVMFRCPNGHDCHLPHEIAPDGTASPSLVCPIEGCTFHEFVRLESWNGGQKPKRTISDVLDQRKRELGMKDPP